MKLRETGILMEELNRSELVVDRGELVEILLFATAEGYKIYINGDKLSVTFDEQNMIANVEPVGVSDNNG